MDKTDKITRRETHRLTYWNKKCFFCHRRGHFVETCQRKIKKDKTEKKRLQEIDSLDYEELMRDIMKEISSQYTTI